MAIDTPATIAVLGAGPIGLEAALYARFLGYSVVIYEQGEVAEHVRQWGHLRMFSPFSANCSKLGIAAIAAQDEAYQPPAGDALVTGSEWRERYLLPLSQTDLLVDDLRLHTKVLGITKGELLKGDLAGNPDRGDWPFRVLTCDAAGNERVDEVDAVFDATGVFSQPNRLGEGGLSARGEQAHREQMAYTSPDILGAHREHYAGQHTVVVGDGHSAASSVIALAQLAASAPGTRVTWLTRQEATDRSVGPVPRISNDPLPARDKLAAEANDLALQGGAVTWQSGVWVQSVIFQGKGWELELTGEAKLACDRIIANVGYRPDVRLWEELQLDQCRSTSRPQVSANSWVTSEPNFYVLGAKSAGRHAPFTFGEGLIQIREIFKLMGDRETLDLYAGSVNLPR